jgi:hypothetical protein
MTKKQKGPKIHVANENNGDKFKKKIMSLYLYITDPKYNEFYILKSQKHINYIDVQES